MAAFYLATSRATSPACATSRGTSPTGGASRVTCADDLLDQLHEQPLRSQRQQNEDRDAITRHIREDVFLGQLNRCRNETAIAQQIAPSAGGAGHFVFRLMSGRWCASSATLPTPSTYRDQDR